MSATKEIPTETKSMIGRMRIGDCLNLYDNDDALLRRYVLQNFERDRAAYWSNATYHSQKLAMFAARANSSDHDKDGKYLDAAAAYAFEPYRGQPVPLLQYFDTLIPLNERAARDLAEAYARAGSWKDEDELLARRLVKP